MPTGREEHPPNPNLKLQASPESLKRCLVSTSRVRLVADIKFESITDPPNVWKKTFQNHICSPASYTHSLFVGCREVVTAGGGEAGGRIRTFTNVVQFKVWGSTTDCQAETEGLPVPLLQLLLPRVYMHRWRISMTRMGPSLNGLRFRRFITGSTSRSPFSLRRNHCLAWDPIYTGKYIANFNRIF
jgi:hypothetical protein